MQRDHSVSAGTGDTTGAPVDLARCFFMFDNLIESETARPEDCPLYFYPPQLPCIDLAGYVSAMVVFAEGFGGHQLSVIQLQRSKLAVKRVDGVTLVLGGREKDADKSIVEHLDDFCRAFCFFYGSFASLIERHSESRAALLRETRRIGEEMLPLIQNYQHNLYASFNPLPLMVLPPHTNRLIVRASQLLQVTGSLRGNLGGAVYCYVNGQTSVLASQLRADATRWVCCRVSYVSDAMSVAGVAAASEHQTRQQQHHAMSQCDMLNVQLPQSMLESMRDEVRAPLHYMQQPSPLPTHHQSAAAAAAVAAGASVRGAERVTPLQQRKPVAPLQGDELVQALALPPVPAGSTYAGLLIVYVGLMSVAVVMDLDSLYDENHVQHVRKLCDERMVRLEAEMRVLVGPIDNGAAAHASAASAVAAAAAATGASASVADSASAAAAVAAAANERGQLISPTSSLSVLPDLVPPSPSAVATPPPSPATPAGSLHNSSSNALAGHQTAASPFRVSATPIRRTNTGIGSSSSSGAPTHHVFSHDAFTGSSFASDGDGGYPELLLESNKVHDHFVSNPSTHEVLLRGQDRVVVCKRMNAREVYYMQQPVASAAVTVFDAENDAKKLLENEYRLHVL